MKINEDNERNINSFELEIKRRSSNRISSLN